MIGNIVGQSIDNYVKDQIKTRQETYGSGFNSERSSVQINYLNSKLSWVKLASSVEIVDQDPFPKLSTTGSQAPTKEGILQQKILSTTPPHGEGTKKLTEIFEGNVENYLGDQLAKKAVLFNGVSEVFEPTTNKNEELIANYKFKKGITTNDNIWNNSAYGLGGLDFGIQPMPGIVSINIQHLNRGSIRKATVQLKAYNKKQFEIIELLYLRLGYTLLLEWGNSNYLTTNKDTKQIEKEEILTTLVDTYWFKNNNSSHLENLKKIEELRKKHEGNYDGFFGRVSNFQWTFANDGSYDISIDLMSLGDVIESLKINIYDDKSLENISDDNINLDRISSFLFGLSKIDTIKKIEKQIEDSKNFKKQVVSIKSLQNEINALKDQISPLTQELIKNYETEYIDLHAIITNKNIFGKNEKYNSELDEVGNNKMNYRYFIRFGAFLCYLQEHIFLQVSNDDSSLFPILNINNDPDINIMYAEPKQFSVDPRICFVKNEYLPSQANVSKNNIKNIFKYIPKSWVSETEEKFIYGKPMNIYLNFSFIIDKIKSNSNSKGELNVYKFLESLCEGINRSLGGINNLQPIIDELTNSITILDQSVVPGKNELLNNEKEEPILEVFGYNSISGSSNFVKNFSFQTEITPELSTTISIGATANGTVVGEDATAFSKWNLGLIDRYNKKIFTPENYKIGAIPDSGSLDIETTSTEDLEKRRNELNENAGNLIYDERIAEKNEINNELRKRKKIKEEKELQEFLNNNYRFYIDSGFGYHPDIINYSQKPGAATQRIPDITTSKYFSLNESFINRGYTILKNNLFSSQSDKYKNSKSPSSSIGFIPFNLSLELEGISGIKIYNKLKLNTKFLPYNYPSTLEFLIKQVNHKLSENNWTTQLETISVPIVPNTQILDKNLKLIGTETLESILPPFSEPVKGMIIRSDKGGSGEYGASRDNGGRAHYAIDLVTANLGLAEKATEIFSPIDGIARRSTGGGKNNNSFTFIIIDGTGEYEGITVKLGYVREILSLEEKFNTSSVPVKRNQLIGESIDLSKANAPRLRSIFKKKQQEKEGYPVEVTDHIHYQVIYLGEPINPSVDAEVINYID